MQALRRAMRSSPVKPALGVRQYLSVIAAALPDADARLRGLARAVAEGDAPYSALSQVADSLVVAPWDSLTQSAFYLPWAALDELGADRGAVLQARALAFADANAALDAAARAGAAIDAEPEDVLAALEDAEVALAMLVDAAEAELASARATRAAT